MANIKSAKKRIDTIKRRRDENKFVNQITKQERRRIVEILKGLSLTITKLRPIAEAIVTAGGVEVDEVNPSTMESKLVKVLYFSIFTPCFKLCFLFIFSKTSLQLSMESFFTISSINPE